MKISTTTIDNIMIIAAAVGLISLLTIAVYVVTEGIACT